MNGTLEHFRDTLGSVGWFIPPYVTVGFISRICKAITDKGPSFAQSDLQAQLAYVYSPSNLAAMVSDRYPITPFVNDYKAIIAESVQAHFMGLDHVAVGGLMPVIEGAARRLAENRGVSVKEIRPQFKALAMDCIRQVTEDDIGVVGELISMLESFSDFADQNLYINSKKHPHLDKTNRHGILHGDYDDEDYGTPINFYKAIAAIDFLCMISALRAHVSWLAPDLTDRSRKLAVYYRQCQRLSTMNPMKEMTTT